MPSELANDISDRVSNVCGIDFHAISAPGQLIKIRPRDALPGSGFTITLTRNINTVEAHWEVDGYAANLVSGLRRGRVENLTEVEALLANTRKAGWTISLQGFGGDGPTETVGISVKSRPTDSAKLADSMSDSAVICVALMLAMAPEDRHDQMESTYVSEGRREGDIREVVLSVRERDPINRSICLAVNGTRCAACGADLGEIYGPVASGFIHVHHKVPLAEYGEGRKIDPVKDLVPLCPTCHMVAHLSRPTPYSVEELKEMLARAKKALSNG